VCAEVIGAAAAGAGEGLATAGDGAVDRWNEGEFPGIGRTKELLGAVYGLGVGFGAEGVGPGAEVYFDPLDSLSRL
jgi:hypothetical protein